MSPARDPWRGRDLRSRPRQAWWLALVVAVVVLVAFLAWRYPDAVYSQSDWAHVAYLVALLALVSAGVVAGRRMDLRNALKQVAAWVGVALLVVVGYSFRIELAELGPRVLGDLLPHRGAEVGEGTIAFRAGADGHFRVEAVVDGTRVRFLVDTGASDVVLSPTDARRLGFDLDDLAFTRFYATANGLVRAAPVRLGEMKVGPIRVSDVRASVNEAAMNSSLLGMSFLDRLQYYEFRDGTLTFGPVASAARRHIGT